MKLWEAWTLGKQTETNQSNKSEYLSSSDENIYVTINSSVCDEYSLSMSAHLSSVCCRNSFRPSNLHTSRCVSYVSWLPMNVQLSGSRGDADQWIIAEQWRTSGEPANEEWYGTTKRQTHICVFLGLTHIWSVDIWCARILWGELPGSWWAVGGRRGCWGSGLACSHNWPHVLCRGES